MELMVDKDEMCKQISDLDPKIRFVGLINAQGRIIAGGMTRGLKSFEDSRDDEVLYKELVLMTTMRKEFDKHMGLVQFTITYRDKLILMSFPVGENIVFISVEKEVDFFQLPFTILKIVQNQS